jgi:hypothetical protein
MNRRQFVNSAVIAGVSAARICRPVGAAESQPNANRVAAVAKVDYESTRETPAKLFDGVRCFAHPRAGIVPAAGKNGQPRVVMTMNTVELLGSDVFKAMYGMTTNDLGRTWSEPAKVDELMPRMETIDGEERPVALSDFWPTWHKHTKTLLGTGHTVAYTTQWEVVDDRPRDTGYAVYDARHDRWLPWQKLPMPGGRKFEFAGAGCTQRVDLPDGTILLPMYYRTRAVNKDKVATVMRCSFDGRTLKYLDHGDELCRHDGTRGLGEPSLVRFNDIYYLTMRHSDRGYVARSRDGLHFSALRPWTFDDNKELGSYETQQHWVQHSDGLFLVYTRRGANNDHVFRHRAPLFMAQVDPEKSVVLRETERELMPNRGARYGNFGVTQISADETWVTDSEWMQPKGVEKYGSDGSIWVARIRWAKPNAAV